MTPFEEFLERAEKDGVEITQDVVMIALLFGFACFRPTGKIEDSDQGDRV